MTTITATPILRSRHADQPDKILSTLLLRYPRCIHAELMTHRLFSRNAASSRAIPVSKLIQDVMENPFIPIYWGKNQKGMQAFEECNELVLANWDDEIDEEDYLTREDAWLMARNDMVRMAEGFQNAGYHKQIVNRLLEPFAHITVLVSSTQWSNFIALRDHPDAEPHIQILAQKVKEQLDRDDNIQTLEAGHWHTPFVTDDDHERIHDHLFGVGYSGGYGPFEVELILDLARKLSVARCASTSYKTVDGFEMTIERAIDLHDKLVGAQPLHASPCEHVAQADEYRDGAKYGLFREGWMNPNLHGNFEGFCQYRKMLPNECL